jgi:predicted Zn-dependent peptidase
VPGQGARETSGARPVAPAGEAGRRATGSPAEVLAPPAAGLAHTEELAPGVLRTVFADGFTVLTEKMDNVRSLAAGLWIRQGTVHESTGQRGISHLLEHMVFKGTNRRSARQIALEIEEVGGNLDAYTTHEHTGFTARVPADHTERALDVLCDMVFSPTLRGRDLEPEREVVLEEIAGVEDAPDQQVFELHGRFLYGSHPYGAPILGTRETASALTEGDLRVLHGEAYRRSNAVFAAAGRVEHEALVESLIGRLPPQAATGPADVGEPQEWGRGTRRVERDGGLQAHVVAAVPGVPYGHPLRYALVLVETALGEGMSSRLFQRVREELGLVYTIYSFHAFYGRAGHAGAYLATRPETAAEAREAMLAELGRLAREGLRPDELTSTREQLKGSAMLSLESPASRMHRLAGTALYDEPFRTMDELAALIDGITAAQAAEAAALFEPDRAAVLELAPA